MREARPQPLLRDLQHAVAGKESFTECSEDCHSQGVSERQALVDSEAFSTLGLCEVHNADDVVGIISERSVAGKASINGLLREHEIAAAGGGILTRNAMIEISNQYSRV